MPEIVKEFVSKKGIAAGENPETMFGFGSDFVRKNLHRKNRGVETSLCFIIFARCGMRKNTGNFFHHWKKQRKTIIPD